MSVRDDFHQLIDKISNETTLHEFYQLVKRLNNAEVGELWNELTEAQKAELLAAYEESFDAENLVNQEEVRRQHRRWLNQ